MTRSIVSGYKPVWLITFLRLPALAVLLAFASGCGGLDKPTAARLDPTRPPGGFDHTNIRSCAVCHGPQGAFNDWPAGHRAIGAQDCAACHSTDSWRTMTSPHSPGAAAPSECRTCHAGQVPSGYVGAIGMVDNRYPYGGLFNHATNHGGAQDCVLCHVQPRNTQGRTWEGGVYTHYPFPTSCNGCHTGAQRPTGASAGPRDHDVIPDGRGDCATCHGRNAATLGKSWALAGVNHIPRPQQCTSCHYADKDYVAIQNQIQFQMNHNAVALPDCAGCHAAGIETATFKYWRIEEVANGNSAPRPQLGVFHRNFTAPLTTCQGCHANERPQRIVGDPPFDHSVSGRGDCATCHTGNSANIGKTWRH